MSEIILSHTDFMDLSAVILQSGNSLRFTAHGYSMAPFICDGDVITIEPVPAETLKVGDVIFYHTGGEVCVAHRIVGRHKEGDEIILRIRGDSSLRYDEKIRSDQIMGKVVEVQREERVIHLRKGLNRIWPILWITFTPVRSIFLRIVRTVRKAIAALV